MLRADIQNIVQDKINEIKKVEPVIEISEQDYIDYRGAGLNSIELLTLIVYLEEHFEFETSDEELSIDRFAQIKDILDLVSEKIAA